MTFEAQQSTINELDELLDQERGALLNGDLEQIARLMTLKEGLIDRINALTASEKQALDHDSISHMQDKMTRNQVLLHGAMEGIRAVADRMAGLRRVREGLETYDRSGQKTQYDTGEKRTVERRA